MSVATQTRKSFAADEKQVLHLVTNALYSNREIFLRELISNASDASDKLRYLALTNADLYENDGELKINIAVDKDAKTLTITDNGIGMTLDEVVENLGTIARSGTQGFKDQMTGDDNQDSNLIGQFGVGFYSAFVVADRVTVQTRKAGVAHDQGVRWESDGLSEYTVENVNRAERGTEITLHMKEAGEEFLEPMRLRTIIAKYSDHIMLPIMMDKPEAPSENQDENEIVVPEQEQVNRATALWTEQNITDEQFKEMYKHLGHDFNDPLAWSHNKVEGSTSYTNVLFIPSKAPFDLWERDASRGLKLYVNRVFIMDDAEHCLPNYLRFVKGIVDANDLPLNISRELLQNDKTITKIRSGCVRRILTLLEKMAENEADKYQQFWSTFGTVIKEGPGEDFANRDRISKLLRFSSTHDNVQEQRVSLEDYVSRMKEKQDKIYYLISDSFNAAKASPLLEVFRQKGIEVLLLSDRIDEWLVAHVTELDGKPLQSISKGSLDMDALDDEPQDEAAKEAKEAERKSTEESFEPVLKAIQEALGERVKEVRLTERLTDSPSCVVFAEDELSGHMQRLLASAGQVVPESKPILELNPKHPILQNLQANAGASVSSWADVLLGQALLAEGETLANPAEFVNSINNLLL